MDTPPGFRPQEPGGVVYWLKEKQEGFGRRFCPVRLEASYMAVQDISGRVRSSPDATGPEALERLEAVLRDPSHGNQRCGHILYRSCAETLACLMQEASEPDLRLRAHEVLQRFSLQTLGDRCMAAARALGGLVPSIPRPSPPRPDAERVGSVDFGDIAAAAGIKPSRCFRAGRSLVLRDSCERGLLVLKFGSGPEEIERLAREAAWLEHLSSHPPPSSRRNHVPRLVRIRDSCLLRISADSGSPFARGLPREGTALAFTAAPDYFAYPQEDPETGPRSPREACRILARGSFLLGRYTSRGILHTAPVPLFHNRIQAGRRDDAGRYLWDRKGRLDRWLHSCRYPNFGASGLRDFEHLTSYSGAPLELFRAAGTQILSLLLVAGSVFRLQDPDLAGLDQAGRPADARHLFHARQLRRMLRTVYLNYFLGFVGRASTGSLPAGLDALVERMIREMGVDRHMNEILRRQDQVGMKRREFESLLRDKGMNAEQIRRTPQAEQDLVLATGPHLGDFNSRISLPELIDFTAACAGTCIAARTLDAIRV